MNITDKITGSKYTSSEFNGFKNETQNAIEASGQTLSAASFVQLAKSQTIAGQTAHSYQDSGVANAYTLTRTGLLEQPTVYIDGMRITFKTANVNTGASTVNVSGLGVKNILLPGESTLSGSEIIPDEKNELIYDASAESSTGAFILAPWSPGLYNRNVKNIASLRKISGSFQGQPMGVLGYDEPGDGGGGPTRIWDEGQAPGFYVDNGGRFIVPTGGDGSAAWIWNYSGVADVKWYGAKGDGVSDDTEPINRASIQEKLKGELFFSTGDYRITDTIFMQFQSKWIGVQAVDLGGSNILFDGPNGIDAISSYRPDDVEKSRFWLEGIRVEDIRIGATSGWGLTWFRSYNRLTIIDCAFKNFKSGSVLIDGTPGNAATDCIEINGVWLVSTHPGHIGINIKNLNNNCDISSIFADVTDGTVIELTGNPNGATTNIRTVKHECSNTTYTTDYATIRLGLIQVGKVVMENIVQSTTTGIGCDIIQTSTAYGGYTMIGIDGPRQAIYGSAPYTFNQITSRPRQINGPIEFAYCSTNGAIVHPTAIAILSPEGQKYGNPGDVCYRTDDDSDVPHMYIKQSGINTNTGWKPYRPSLVFELAIDMPSIPNLGTTTFEIDAPGTSIGDFVTISATTGRNFQYTGIIVSGPKVAVIVSNLTGAAVDPGLTTVRALVTPNQ